MKILYIGGEQSDAHGVATALRGVDQDVKVSWASGLEPAARWLDENRDLAAIVVEAQTNGDSWPSVLKHARGPALHPAVVAIVPEGAGPPFEWLRPEPDDYIPRNGSLARDLPIVVTRAVARTRGRQQVELDRVTCADLEQKLAHATAALQDTEQRHQAALAAAGEQLAERQTQYEFAMARATATWEMVDEQLRVAALEVGRARQDQASAAADVDRLSREALELTSQLAEAAATHRALEGRLAEARTAVDAANARTEHERLAAADQSEERRRQFEALIAQEVERRRSVEDLLAQTVSARDDAERRHASATSDVERLTTSETDLSSRLADVTASRNDLERRLAATKAAFDDASMRTTRERLAASKRAAEREAGLDGQIRQQRERCTTLEQAVTDADAALRDAEQRHEAALSAAAGDLAERQARFDRELSQTVADRDHVSQRLRDAELALDNVRHDHQTAAADVERLTQREADLTSRLADVQATRDALDLQLAEARNAIADADAALRDAEQRHKAALSAAASDLAKRQARFDRELSQTVADRDHVSQRLSAAEIALANVRHDHQTAAADVERLTQLEADLTSRLADVQAARDAVERQLADTASALKHSSAHETELEGQIQQERATRTTLEQAIADANAALDQIRRDQQSTAADVERLTQREAALTFQLGGVEAARDTLEHRLADAVNAMADMDERAAREHSAAVDRQADLEARLAHETATRTAVEQTLNETRAAALDAQRSFEEQASALRARGLGQEAQFEVFLAQAQLEHESRLAEMQGCNRTLALDRDALQQSLTTVQEQSQQLQETLAATAKALEVATRRTEVLRSEADQLPRLHEQLDEIRVDNNRLFEQAGLAMFRCTPDGALIHANRACTTLVGRRTLDQLPGAQFAAAVFEAPDVLSWLIERCSSTRAKESIETTWQRSDGGRLYVRLSARRLTPHDVIEVTAEDLTRLRVLQARLDQAHRMEAVGRFASEVAVTCGNLLSDIHQNGQQWLTKAGCNVGSRQQGELLIDEVRRAADLLHQLAAFGDEQARTPVLVDLNTLIRDLQPVLKRVAGNHVEIQLRDPSSPLTVDVQTERVERLLVNLASYGRERMPSGGRLRIDLGTIVVNRHFAAKHPHVRLGLHALITVTGIRTAARAEGEQQAHAHVSPRGHGRSARFGVDVGTLHGLVSECGGHLWMTVQPAGDMVAKIRLPLLSPHDQVFTRVAAFRGARERSTTR